MIVIVKSTKIICCSISCTFLLREGTCKLHQIFADDENDYNGDNGDNGENDYNGDNGDNDYNVYNGDNGDVEGKNDYGHNEDD